jgi:hypothetical protein
MSIDHEGVLILSIQMYVDLFIPLYLLIVVINSLLLIISGIGPRFIL